MFYHHEIYHIRQMNDSILEEPIRTNMRHRIYDDKEENTYYAVTSVIIKANTNGVVSYIFTEEGFGNKAIVKEEFTVHKHVTSREGD